MISQGSAPKRSNVRLAAGLSGRSCTLCWYVLFATISAANCLSSLVCDRTDPVTGWSYVEMGRKVKQFAGRIGRQFGFKLKELIALVRRRTPAKNKPSPQAQPSSDERDDAEDVSDLAPAISERPEPVHPVHETPLIRDFEEHRAIEDKIEERIKLQIEPDHSDDYSETEQDEATPSGQLV